MTNVTDNGCQLGYTDGSAGVGGGYVVFECFQSICICMNSKRFIECYKIL